MWVDRLIDSIQCVNFVASLDRISFVVQQKGQRQLVICANQDKNLWRRRPYRSGLIVNQYDIDLMIRERHKLRGPRNSLIKIVQFRQRTITKSI